MRVEHEGVIGYCDECRNGTAATVLVGLPLLTVLGTTGEHSLPSTHMEGITLLCASCCARLVDLLTGKRREPREVSPNWSGRVEPTEGVLTPEMVMGMQDRVAAYPAVVSVLHEEPESLPTREVIGSVGSPQGPPMAIIEHDSSRVELINEPCEACGFNGWHICPGGVGIPVMTTTTGGDDDGPGSGEA